MKILFVLPPFFAKNFFLSAFPTGVGVLAGIAEQSGHEVRVEDLYHLGSWDQVTYRLWPVVHRFRPDLVGIPCLTTTRHTVFELARRIKSWQPSAKIVLGGHHATFLAEQILTRYPQVDYICLGESDESFRELADSLSHDVSPDLIQGLAFRSNGDVHVSGAKLRVSSAGNAPRIPYHLFDMDLYALMTPVYKHFQWKGRPLSQYKRMTMVTSRGCPFKCRFCSSSAFWGHTCSTLSPERIVEEIEFLQGRYGVAFFEFLDDLFTLNQDRLHAFCDELERKNLSIAWSAYSRVDTVNSELLRRMNEAGCLAVFYGVESGSTKMLKRMGKSFSLTQAERAFQWTKQADMKAFFLLLVGYPGEDHETVMETRDFLSRLQPDNVFSGGPMIVYPGTKIYEQALREGFLTSEAWIENPKQDILYTAEHEESVLRDMIRAATFFRDDMEVFAAGLDKKEVRKILLLRTAPPYIAERVEGKLRTLFPDASMIPVCGSLDGSSSALVNQGHETAGSTPGFVGTFFESHRPDLLVLLRDALDNKDPTDWERWALEAMPEGRAVRIDGQGRVMVLSPSESPIKWASRQAYQRVRSAGIQQMKLKLPPFPRRIDIEVTNACNLKCRTCPRSSMTRPVRHMDSDLWKRIHDEIRSFGLVESWFHLFGEPLMHPNLFDMLEYGVASNSILLPGLSTNCTLLSREATHNLIESGLKRLILSLDGVEQADYENNRIGGRFDEVLGNVERFVSLYAESGRSSKPEVSIQIIETQENAPLVRTFEALWREKLKDTAGIKVFRKPFMDFAGNVPTSLSSPKPSAPTPCVGLWNELAVYADGRITTCCFDVNATQVVGDLSERSIEDVWRSEALHEYRRHHREGTWDCLPLCRQCGIRSRKQYCDDNLFHGDPPVELKPCAETSGTEK